ncbi:MAG: chromosomal replication initiator protein DnaA [Patescibacteria group bacterium]
MTNPELWRAVLGELELSLTKANFTTWFKNTNINSFDGGKIIISVPNGFTKAWLEKRYHQAIVKSLQSILGEDIKSIEYRVDLKPQENAQDGPMKFDATAAITSIRPNFQPQQHEVTNPFGLKNNYTFDNFVVGKGNELAHAAAQAVASNPGEIYNPLFIYGGSGLGKTHLLHAIGNQVLKNFPHFKPLYVTSERFTNEFINNVRGGQMRAFKDRYRNIDLLLIDDIQFIGGKVETQEEFFHTFNALHQTNKHVILSSDRPPKSIPALEQRLLTRLEWGLLADISMPDLETRIAILEKKCMEKGCNLDRSIVHYIALNIVNNIRELESVLNKILAYQELQHTPPTIDMVKGILAGFATTSQKRTASSRQFMTAIANFYDIQMEELLGQSREKRLAGPRQILMYLLKEENGMSFPNIGKEVGDRDHTTAIHAHRKITREVEDNAKIRSEVEAIKNKIYSQPIT